MIDRRSAILTYHSIDDTGSVISIKPDAFRAQMRFLADSGASVVGLEEIPRNPGAVAITFDDGFLNFYKHAFPVLQGYRFPATVFAVSGYCGKHNSWPSQPSGIPMLELMSWNQLKEVANHGVSLGAHTVNHPRLTELTHRERECELRECRLEIEERVGKGVTALAYPYGDFDESVRQLAAAHFETSCTTVLDYLTAEADPLALPRLDMFYLRNQFWFVRLGTGLGRHYLAARRHLRTLRRPLN